MEARYDELKPLNARCDTNEVEILVYPIDPKVELNEAAIRNVIALHGTQAKIAMREQNKKDEKAKEDLIQAEIREQAVAELKKKGKLNADGSLKK